MNARVMNRYTFKALLDTHKELNSMLAELKNIGVKRDDVDLAFLPSKSNKGFAIKKRRKAYYMSVYAALIGAVVGLTVAIANGFNVVIQAGDTTIPAIYSSLMYYGLGFAFFAAIIGFAAGWSLISHEIIYAEKGRKLNPQILLAANTDFDKRNLVENIFKGHLKDDYEIIDNNYENEMGLR